MRLIDPTKTKVFHERTHLGRNITRREHFNGSVDAKVQLRAVKIIAHAPPTKSLVAAIAEVEAATREWRVAKHSESDEWKRYVKTRLRVANERLAEVQ